MPVTEIDNRDDRREILVLLSKLDRGERIRFLIWCRDRANERKQLRHNPPWVFVYVYAVTGTPVEAWNDLILMINEHDLPLDVVLPELERRASK